MSKIPGGCGRQDCNRSTGIHNDGRHLLSGLTFGRGELDDYGYFEQPCELCARAFESARPEAYPCWPFEPTDEWKMAYAALERLRLRFEELRVYNRNKGDPQAAGVFLLARGAVEEEIALLHGFGPFELR